MKLKWQISIIAILSLSFPWVVWQAFKSLNQTYQDNILAAAGKQAQVIVNSVQQYKQDRSTELDGFIPTPLTTDVAVDGMPTEWAAVPWYVLDYRLKFKLGSHQQQLHLLVEVLDNSLYIDHNQQSDHLTLAVGEDRGINKYRIDRQAEGLVSRTFGDSAYTAYWHETANGYQVEIQLNNPAITRLGLVVTDHATADSAVSFGHLSDNQIQLQPLFEAREHWRSFLQQITPEDGEITLKDSQGRIYYQNANSQHQITQVDWLTELIYEFAFDQNQADGSHFFGQRVNQAFDAGQIELTIKHNTAQLALIQTFIQSVMWIFGIALSLLAGYFIFALILAWRIRRLNKTLQNVLDDQGHINTLLPSNHAKDEIGDLSRRMTSLLTQINEYTEYLKQLGSRLSHEMKTPISIVHTSLENLQMEQPDNEFVKRALNANHRLKFILNQLSALSKLKQVISETRKERFDLNLLISDLINGYQTQVPNISFQSANRPIMINGSQELMAQMIDKLVQNAQDFATHNDQIKIKLSRQESKAGQRYELKVMNTGSQIPIDKMDQLFDSLTSFRSAQDPDPHLGLGLYIAKLICDYHQATIHASNIDEPTAVEFVIVGPYSP